MMLETCVSYHAACYKTMLSDLPHPPKLVVADPHCWANTQSKDTHVSSIIDDYHANGVFPVPGNNNWEKGYNAIYQALMVDPTVRHPVTGVLGCPRLPTFSTCPNFIREIQNYKWKKARGAILRNTPDEPIDYNDHSLDETVYVFSVMPTWTPTASPTPTMTALDKVHQAVLRYNPLTVVTPRGGPDGWMTS